MGQNFLRNMNPQLNRRNYGENQPDAPRPNRPDFSDRSLQAQVFDIFLADEQTDKVLKISGNYFHVIDASASTATVQVQFNNEIMNPVSVTEGFSVQGFKFSQLLLTHNAQSGAWIKVLVLFDPGLPFELKQAPATLTVNANKYSTLPDTLFSFTGSVAEETLAANANRAGVWIQNPTGNLSPFSIGSDSGVTDVTGIPIPSGESVLLTGYTGPIFAITPAIVPTNETILQIEHV